MLGWSIVISVNCRTVLLVKTEFICKINGREYCPFCLRYCIISPTHTIETMNANNNANKVDGCDRQCTSVIETYI